MSFKSFFQITQENPAHADLSLLMEANYSYVIPTNKEIMMYDFYMISHWLNALNYGVGPKVDAYGQEENLGSHRMGLRDSTRFSFEHIKEQLLNHLQKELLEASFFSICCELRHWNDAKINQDIIKGGQKGFTKEDWDYIQYFDYAFKKESLLMQQSDEFKQKEIDREHEKNRLKFGKNKSQKTDYMASYMAGKKTLRKFNITTYDIAKLAKKIFDNKILSWSGSFGGAPWQEIAQAHMYLYRAKKQMEQTIYIDNMYHQQHNTDTVFNKIYDYFQPGSGYAWVLKALEFKANNKEPYELIRKIKELNQKNKVFGLRSVDKMYIEMLKAAGRESYNEYFDVKKDHPHANKKEERKTKLSNSYYI